MTDQELKILISVKNEATPRLREINQEVSRINTTTKDFARNATLLSRSLGGVGYEASRATMIFSRFGVAGGSVALAFVAMAKSFSDVRKPLSEMRTSARELGISFEELQRLKTGIAFSKEDLRNLEQAQEGWAKIGQFFKNLWNSLGVGIGKLLPKSDIDLLGKTAEDSLKRINVETKRLTLSTQEYRRYQYETAYQNYRDLLQLELDLSDAQREIRQKSLNEWQRVQEQTLAYARWGFKTYKEDVEKIQQDFAQNTSALFSNVFIDGLDNRLMGSRDIFRQYLVDLRNMIIKFAMERAVAEMFIRLMPTASPIPKVNLGRGSVFGGGSTGGSGYGGGFAEGGIVSSPSTIMVGEAGPEAIVPLNKSDRFGGDTIINIFAIDTQSFAEALRRNPDTIVSIINENISRNGSLRHKMRGDR